MRPWIELNMDFRYAVRATTDGIEARLRRMSSKEPHYAVLLVGSTNFPRGGLSYFAGPSISLVANDEQNVLQRHILWRYPKE